MNPCSATTASILSYHKEEKEGITVLEGKITLAHKRRKGRHQGPRL
jgi:hypothetical protein